MTVAQQQSTLVNPLLEIKDLRVSFQLPEGVLEAVRGASFSIARGGTVALVGESGSGKSVISQAIMGILPRVARISGGEILFRDPKNSDQAINLAQLNPESSRYRDLRGGRMSIIFQEPMTSLSPVHTVGDQVGEALALHSPVSKAEGLRLVEEMLRLTGFPDPARALKTYPFELSGGLRQRAMIAMALVCRPALLIADEPTTALDVTIQAQILKLIKDLQAELGMAVLMITHDLGVVANVAEDVVVMYHGQIMESGNLEEIFHNPQHPYLKALLHAVPRFNMDAGERLEPLREIGAKEKAEALSQKMGHKGDAASGEHLLSMMDVSKSFRIRKSGWIGSKSDKVRALDGITLSIRHGECLGLVGESGCGKSTLSKVIMRAVTPDSGQINYHAKGGNIDILGLKGVELNAFRRRVQYVFQDPFSSLNPRMRVGEILCEPLDIHRIGKPEERNARVEELLELVGLGRRHLQRYPHSFSGGQRQRIGIARALALDPELLILDEPVSALDVSIQAQVLNLLRDLRAALGLTYLFISHNLAVVNYVADRIAVMYRGRIVELAPNRRLFEGPVHPYTQTLLKAVPEPDLSRLLDFEHLHANKSSGPEDWPDAFQLAEGETSSLIDLGDGHMVRANPNRTSASQLLSTTRMMAEV
ncbi:MULTISPECIES: ABC transporter ATP-binding protein [Limibacillus]|jgi:peptide/nickel transport system ATP-binding protein|uniref:Peptide/nickel transport system ATP-binding protein n=1 Tax=Limibacillus halophilus TaxID=1579333 RepID=A0A839SSB8_9PROT|nr:ABC transporter ATP-binding protein [Limibacillus halophilus]MBB3063905.1 peptide/nickel transport system ATP-binding protein [Limibacillus halophilus]